MCTSLPLAVVGIVLVGAAVTGCSGGSTTPAAAPAVSATAASGSAATGSPLPASVATPLNQAIPATPSTPATTLSTVTRTAAASPVAPTHSAPSSGATVVTRYDPCALATAADARTALGRTVGAGRSTVVGQFPACIYVPPSDGSASLIVLVRAIDKASFDKSISVEQGGPVTPVAGIGVEAYSNKLALLTWARGTEILVQVTGARGDLLAAEKRVATAALSRL